VVTHPLPSQQPAGQEAALQATHAPPAQIWPEPQGCPSLMLLGEVHTGPAVQDIDPCWHGLPGGAHVEFAVHATHAPWPSHTPLGTLAVWQGVPALAEVL